MRFRGTTFQALGKFGARVEAAFDVAWDQSAIESIFPLVSAASKDAVQLWSAARYFEGTRRGNDGIDMLYAAVLDADCTDVGTLDAVCESLTSSGLAYVAYTSWSHRDAGKVHAGSGRKGPFDSFRVVLPFSREVTKAEYAALVPALFGREVPADPAHYAAEVAGRTHATASGRRTCSPRGWDPASARPSQAYYVPACPASRAPYAALDVHVGRPLAVDTILARPTTVRVTSATVRTYQAPTAQAAGAASGVAMRLAERGVDVSGPGYEGWFRAACPACAPDGQQKSPSFTFRGNGDGLDLRCYSGCSRGSLLDALGIRTDSGAFAAPSNLRIELDEQLAAQAPRRPPMSVQAASEWLQQNIREALDARTPTVIEAPAGVGKSHASAQVMTDLAREGWRVAYATQEHAVAHETRMKLPPDVRARSVHIHSPLVQVGDGPVCQRAHEVKEQVFEFGVSLLGSICPVCPHRETCAAHEEARQRAAQVDDASVVFVSHAGIQQVFGTDSEGRAKGADTLLIVDEMPGTYEDLCVSVSDLTRLAARPVLSSAAPMASAVVAELSRAWLAGEAPGEVRVHAGATSQGSALDFACEWGRLPVREGAVRVEEQDLLRAADAVVRLAAHRADGGTVLGDASAANTGIAAMLPDPCHAALVRRKGVLLSATPLMAALPDFAVRSIAVADSAPVRRIMVLRRRRGSRALTQNYYDDTIGIRRVRDAEPGEEPGIPWPWVDEAIERALAEADRYSPTAKVLFVTFKKVADMIRACETRSTHPRLEVAHYGALRGKNEWMEGRERECQVVYCFGTPRFAMRATLYQLGLRGEALTQAWAAYAAGELTQAEGRLRLPRRTKPCTVVVEGDVAPLGWHHDSITKVITTAAHDLTATALLEGALMWRTRKEVADMLGVSATSVSRWQQPGCPPPAERHLPVLAKLANPSTEEAFDLFGRMSPSRRKALREEFQWAPLDEDE